jgi:hypothetical protein
MPRVGFETTTSVFKRTKMVHVLDRAAIVIGFKQTYWHVFYLHVATINVYSSDLTRKFIGTIAEITRNSYNTHVRV